MTLHSGSTTAPALLPIRSALMTSQKRKNQLRVVNTRLGKLSLEMEGSLSRSLWVDTSLLRVILNSLCPAVSQTIAIQNAPPPMRNAVEVPITFVNVRAPCGQEMLELVLVPMSCLVRAQTVLSVITSCLTQPSIVLNAKTHCLILLQGALHASFQPCLPALTALRVSILNRMPPLIAHHALEEVTTVSMTTTISTLGPPGQVPMMRLPAHSPQKSSPVAPLSLSVLLGLPLLCREEPRTLSPLLPLLPLLPRQERVETAETNWQARQATC